MFALSSRLDTNLYCCHIFFFSLSPFPSLLRACNLLTLLLNVRCTPIPVSFLGAKPLSRYVGSKMEDIRKSLILHKTNDMSITLFVYTNNFRVFGMTLLTRALRGVCYFYLVCAIFCRIQSNCGSSNSSHLYS